MAVLSDRNFGNSGCDGELKYASIAAYEIHACILKKGARLTCENELLASKW